MVDLWDPFAGYLRAKDRSDLTISGYLQDLRLFADWFRVTNGEEPAPEAITPLDVREYRSHLVNVQRQEPATVNRKLAALRAWLAWAQSTGQIEVNPAEGIKGVKSVEQPPRWLGRKETYALLRELQKAEQAAAARAGGNAGHPATVQARRDCAVIALLLHTGLRVSELVALQVGDVEVSDRKGQVVVRFGKGGKQRTVPLNVDARRAVRAWLDVRRGGVDRLFYGKQGEPLTERGVQHLVSRYGRLAGLEGVTPHSLRHTFGKSLVDAGVSLDRVAKLMGHDRLDTTKVYTTPSAGDLAVAVEQVAWTDGPA